MSVNFGSKRVVTGAHYGLRDWMAQRATAVLMALFTVLLLAQVLLTSGPITYAVWAGIFAAQWMKVFTFTVILSLLYHVWVGMRDIWMDYIKPVGLRSGTTSVYLGLADCVCRLGHSSSLETLSHDDNLNSAKATFRRHHRRRGRLRHARLIAVGARRT